MATNDQTPQHQGETPPHVLFRYAATGTTVVGVLPLVMQFLRDRPLENAGDFSGPVLAIAGVCWTYAGILKSFGLLAQAIRRRRAQQTQAQTTGRAGVPKL